MGVILTSNVCCMRPKLGRPCMVGGCCRISTWWCSSSGRDRLGAGELMRDPRRSSSIKIVGTWSAWTGTDTEWDWGGRGMLGESALLTVKVLTSLIDMFLNNYISITKWSYVSSRTVFASRRTQKCISCHCVVSLLNEWWRAQIWITRSWVRTWVYMISGQTAKKA